MESTKILTSIGVDVEAAKATTKKAAYNGRAANPLKGQRVEFGIINIVNVSDIEARTIKPNAQQTFNEFVTHNITIEGKEGIFFASSSMEAYAKILLRKLKRAIDTECIVEFFVSTVSNGNEYYTVNKVLE